jgi:hypothetical protein
MALLRDCFCNNRKLLNYARKNIYKIVIEKGTDNSTLDVAALFYRICVFL